MDERYRYEQARKQVRRKKGFYRHFSVYLIVNLVLNILVPATGGDFGEPLPLLLVWGIPILIHYVSVFGIPGSGVLSKSWEDREMEKELGKLPSAQVDDFPEDPEELELPELRKNYDDKDFV